MAAAIAGNIKSNYCSVYGLTMFPNPLPEKFNDLLWKRFFRGLPYAFLILIEQSLNKPETRWRTERLPEVFDILADEYRLRGHTIEKLDFPISDEIKFRDLYHFVAFKYPDPVSNSDIYNLSDKAKDLTKNAGKN